MSVSARRHLPEHPSLEQLRKQAREHLNTLRAADPSVNLAAAQHALAREYGFESWPKLDEALFCGNPTSLPELRPGETLLDLEGALCHEDVVVARRRSDLLWPALRGARAP